MSRVELTDNLLDVFGKMAEGNPGALAAMMDIVEKHPAVDPQAAMGGLGVIMSFDDMEIYGSAIYVLWSDKCGKDSRKLIMLMRARQLGFFSEDKIKRMAADQMREIDLTPEEYESLDKQVCDQLESFQRPTAKD